MAQDKPDSGVAQARQRLDKWLFFARIAKSRSLAQAWISAGHVHVNGAAVRQPAHLVKPGDRIEVSAERKDLVLAVLLPGERRGPFEEARHLYQDVTPERPKDRLTNFELATRDRGAGRPTKKDRRAIDRLRDEDND
jgi:ribosome-associated heat shock protein Hsp15